MRKIMLSAKTISVKDLEDPKIEAFVYNNSFFFFFIKSQQVTLPQCVTIVCKDHSLMAPIPPLTPHRFPLIYLFPVRLGTKKGELD